MEHFGHTRSPCCRADLLVICAVVRYGTLPFRGRQQQLQGGAVIDLLKPNELC